MSPHEGEAVQAALIADRVYPGQKGQDRWVIEEVFPGKRGGWFLDLAATDGVALSNTVLLERDLGWNGLCIEPNPGYRDALRRNRGCQIAHTCIDEVEGVVEFLPNGELGGIVDEDTDNSPAIRGALLEECRRDGKIIRIPAIPLAQLLDQHGAPPVIDYFSFDVEGAETRILRSFPFNRYRFLAMTIERPTLEINELLFSNGYQFVKNVNFDSFYIHESYEGDITREPFEQIPPKDW